MQNQKLKGGLVARVNALFTDREIIMHADGQVRFLAISARLQKRVALTACAVIGLWLIITLAMTVSQLTITGERIALAQEKAAVHSDESEVAAYKASINGVTQDLIQRQDAMEQIIQQFIGDEALAIESPDAQKEALSDNERKLLGKSKEISAAFPELATLAKLEARQIAFAHRLIRVADARTERAEAAIRKLGLNPAPLSTPSAKAVGGPFIPLYGDDETKLHPTLKRLNTALLKMDHVESMLLTIPSAIPTGSTGITKVSSGFGVRSDPFNGRGAMHSGIDFKGTHGQPVLSAARGVVTHAGWRSGYGKTVEVTHGNGLMTRYAHLSRIKVRTGQKIKRGVQLGAMGSTGRSTGTHLHFEVRLNGAAINPRPFLKENTDVLKVQALARKRAADPDTASAARTSGTTSYAKNTGSSRG